MNQLRQQFNTLFMSVLIFLAGIIPSHAATAALDLNWDSFSATVYSFDPTGTSPSTIPFFSGSDWVYADHDAMDDSQWENNWTGINAAAGSASAETTGSTVAAQISLDAGGNVSASAGRNGYIYPTDIYPTDNGILELKVDYTWNLEGFDPDPLIEKYVSGGLNLSASYYDDQSNKDVWFDCFTNFYFDNFGTAASSSDSGSLYLYINLDSLDLDSAAPIDFYTEVYLSGNSPIPVSTPIPGSMVMLFSGVVGLTIFKRRK
jgi:hypothetical protein